MLYLAFSLNVFVLAASAFELHQVCKERQSLSLLIKGRDVAEFVRAERRLAPPTAAIRRSLLSARDQDGGVGQRGHGPVSHVVLPRPAALPCFTPRMS